MAGYHLVFAEMFGGKERKRLPIYPP